MFYCAITKCLSKTGEKPIRLVTKRREKEYTITNENGDRTVIGRGWEIVKEVDVTLEGLRMWCESHPDDLAAGVAFAHQVKADQARKRAALRAGVSATGDSSKEAA